MQSNKIKKIQQAGSIFTVITGICLFLFLGMRAIHAASDRHYVEGKPYGRPLKAASAPFPELSPYVDTNNLSQVVMPASRLAPFVNDRSPAAGNNDKKTTQRQGTAEKNNSKKSRVSHE